MNNIKLFINQLPKKHKVSLSLLITAVVVLLLISTENATASKSAYVDSLQVGKRYQIDVPNELHENQVTKNDSLPELKWQLAKVKKGDTLARIFNRLGFSAKTTHEIAHANGADKHLINLNIGDELRIGTNEENELIELIYPISSTKTLTISLQDNEYVADIDEKLIETRIAYANAVIQSNFWNAGIEAGMSDGQIMHLANIFGWDIDFALDIREGDTFNVVYENNYVDGELVGEGHILAAEFINQNEKFQAIRFTDGDYYTPEGNNLRKSYLRAPVNFKYISSSFKPNRFHPILKRWKAHNGVDYRANTGTPVLAAGHGRVSQSSYNKYNGNYVFIEHGDGIVTKYLHFSKRNVKKGERVKQGDVIGYVGATGLAEAPHLHYEFLVNGVHRNPRTVKLPKSKPIEDKYKTAFNNIATDLLALLEGSKRTLLAKQ